MQTWAYCLECWSQCKDVSPDVDPRETVLKYRAFLEFIVGQQDRRFNGNQATKIGPAESH
jgi:hypothetical protein